MFVTCRFALGRVSSRQTVGSGFVREVSFHFLPGLALLVPLRRSSDAVGDERRWWGLAAWLAGKWGLVPGLAGDGGVVQPAVALVGGLGADAECGADGGPRGSVGDRLGDGRLSF